MNYGAITQVDADVLDEVFAEFKNQVVNVLEIGVWKGDTARGMKAACERNLSIINYTGIDAQSHAEPNPPFEGAKYIIMPSDEAWMHIQPFFDVIFVDGCHCLNHVILDAIHYRRRLLSGGFIIFHDTAPHIQQVQTNPWVHGSKHSELYNTAVCDALDMVGWDDRVWKLWKNEFDSTSDIGGVIVYRKM